MKCFKCDICEKKFTARVLLINHVSINHRFNGMTSVTCSLCDKFFSNEFVLKNHENSVHLNNPIKLRKLKCKHCEETFTHASSLNQHVKIWTLL